MPPGRTPDSSASPRPWFVVWGPALAYAAGIFVLSAIPDMPAPPMGVSDKTAHSTLYSGFAVTLVWGFAGGRLAGLGWRSALAAIAAASLYGVTDEFHQSFVPGRTCDVFDWMADTRGAMLVAAAALALAWIRSRRTAAR